ncbi:hypothetical protein [Pseudomonas leptonychotis]|uniref:hypothetical protein n=1 Tax=Pseudomonas leptonychotis TaxID=2448482 RepID=UPI00386B9815
MAKGTQERSAKSAIKAAAAREEELRHKVRPGTRAMLADLMRWHGITVISEAIQSMIINLHALGPTASAHALKTPRHTFEISENVARDFHNESMRELCRDPGDEYIAPPN